MPNFVVYPWYQTFVYKVFSFFTFHWFIYCVSYRKKKKATTIMKRLIIVTAMAIPAMAPPDNELLPDDVSWEVVGVPSHIAEYVWQTSDKEMHTVADEGVGDVVGSLLLLEVTWVGLGVNGLVDVVGGGDLDGIDGPVLKKDVYIHDCLSYMLSPSHARPYAYDCIILSMTWTAVWSATIAAIASDFSQICMLSLRYC